MTGKTETRKHTARSIDIGRCNTKAYRVHLDPGWEGEDFSPLKMVAERESTGTRGEDSPRIDDPDYDFVRRLSLYRG